MIWASGFERLWTLYPQHANREAAKRAYETLDPDDELLDVIVADLVARRKRAPWAQALERGDLEFIPDLSSYLNEQRWTDDGPMPSNVVPFRRRITPPRRED